MINQNKIYKDVATLHIKSIKNGFLPTLGINFLTLLYKTINECSFATLETEYNGNELKGFVSGTDGTSSLYKQMLKYPLSLLICLFPVLFNPIKIKKIINIFFHMHGKKRSDFPNAELLTICVDDGYRRQGVANILYKRLSSYFKKRNIKKFTIIVGKTLEANKFYLNQGAVISSTIQVHKGHNSNIFIQEL